MAWIAPAITVAGGVVKSMMDQQNAQKAPTGTPMDLGKMMLQDSSMNNSGWVVTTNGSTANATANTSRTLTPSTQASASFPSAYGIGASASGFDFTPLLIVGALFLAFKK